MEKAFLRLPYLAFVGLLGIVYIANTHFAERNMRNMQQLQKEIKEFKWQHTELKSEIIYSGMQSELTKDLKELDKKKEGNIPKLIRASES